MGEEGVDFRVPPNVEVLEYSDWYLIFYRVAGGGVNLYCSSSIDALAVAPVIVAAFRVEVTVYHIRTGVNPGVSIIYREGGV